MIHRIAWTRKEDTIIEKHWPSGGMDVVKQLLDDFHEDDVRTCAAIACRASRLGVKLTEEMRAGINGVASAKRLAKIAAALSKEAPGCLFMGYEIVDVSKAFNAWLKTR
jgi:hypothetical protein